MNARARARAAAVLALVLLAPRSGAAGAAPAASRVSLDVRQFRPVEGPSSGPAVYYEVVEEHGVPILRGTYRPGLETVAMGIAVPEHLRKRARLLRWRWRARAFPVGGNECRGGHGDSTASVIAAFKRGLRWYMLKYVWSPVAPLGAVCDKKRTLFLVRDTIVLESGGATGAWLSEVVDLRRSFIDHFAGGDRSAEVPDLLGIAVMTDGDQTRTEASADWAGFQIE
jgi:hypothetical protein